MRNFYNSSVVSLPMYSNPRILKGFLLNFGVLVLSEIVAPPHIPLKFGGKKGIS
jgi:hypothetical protein